MRAVVVRKYSPKVPEAMSLVSDFPRPVAPSEYEVIVRVVAAAINGIDVTKVSFSDATR